MKKLITFILATLTAFSLTACGGKKIEENQNNSNSTEKTLTVGATAVPHAEMLNEVVDNLQEKGIKLVIKEFSDYSLLNKSLEEGQIDANFFQHMDYLEKDISKSGAKLVSIGAIHTEPMGIYSNKIKSLDELKDGDKVAIPNDETNLARALLLLEKNGIIKLKDGVSSGATVLDIIENPKNIEIMELDAATLPRTLDEVAISVINTNYALVAGFNPMEDSLGIEDLNSPYANILVVREGDENKEEIKALYEALTSEEMKNFIEEKYNGAVIPIF